MTATDLVGHQFEPFEADIERGRVALFCEAIGERNPLFTDPTAARASGYRDTVVPPTMLGLGLDPRPFDFLELLDIPLPSILHGEQQMEYHEVVCVGDRLRGQKTLTKLYEKKGGALKFIVIEVAYRDLDDKPVCTSRQTIIARRPEASA